MFEEGDRVELVEAIEVSGLPNPTTGWGAGVEFRVVRVLPGRLALEHKSGQRLTLPARLLRRV